MMKLVSKAVVVAAALGLMLTAGGCSEKADKPPDVESHAPPPPRVELPGLNMDQVTFERSTNHLGLKNIVNGKDEVYLLDGDTGPSIAMVALCTETQWEPSTATPANQLVLEYTSATAMGTLGNPASITSLTWSGNSVNIGFGGSPVTRTLGSANAAKNLGMALASARKIPAPTAVPSAKLEDLPGKVRLTIQLPSPTGGQMPAPTDQLSFGRATNQLRLRHVASGKDETYALGELGPFVAMVASCPERVWTASPDNQLKLDYTLLTAANGTLVNPILVTGLFWSSGDLTFEGGMSPVVRNLPTAPAASNLGMATASARRIPAPAGGVPTSAKLEDTTSTSTRLTVQMPSPMP